MKDTGRARGPTFQRVGSRDGNERLSLGRVLFPLRYDIYVQAPFLSRFYKARQGDVDRIATVIEDAPDYMTQRIRIMLTLRQKWNLLTEGAEPKFERRVYKYNTGNIGKLLGIWEQVRVEGYKGSGKGRMVFKQAMDSSLTYEDHELPGEDALYLTNGQHRCVVLLAMGRRYLEPSWYGVAQVKGFRPIESTHEYIKQGLITESQFIDFARLRFPAIPEDAETIQDLSNWGHSAGLDPWFHYYLDIYWGVR